MDKGSIKEQGPHDELMRIPIEKEADGSMITGWYRDLWQMQMGQPDEPKKLEALEDRIKKLEVENLRLRKGALKLDIQTLVTDL